MNKTNRIFAALIAVAAIGVSPKTGALELISNGGFESGFANWSRADALGSDGTFALQTGTTSPVNGIPVPPPPGGLAAAMTDAGAGGSHVLYQDFVVPSVVGTAALRFDLYIGNGADRFASPNTLDFAAIDNGSAVLNQQARIDILQSGADPFSIGSSDVLLNLFQTQPGDPLVSGYNTLSLDVAGLFANHLGETLRLRFAETDNLLFFQLGVDNVSLTVGENSAVPDSSIGSLGLITLAGICWVGRRYGLSAQRLQ